MKNLEKGFFGCNIEEKFSMPEIKNKIKLHSKDEKDKLVKEMKKIIERTEEQNRALGKILEGNGEDK